MRLLCTVFLCLLLCGCFATPPRVPQRTIKEQAVQQIIIKADFTDKEPQRYRLGWPLTIGLAVCMFLMPIIMTKARKL